IAGYATDYDVKRILETIHHWQPSALLADDYFASYRAEQLIPRWRTVLKDINDFFDYQLDHQPKASGDIPQLTARRIAYLSAKRLLGKVKAKLKQ
ncbi:MAG: glycosyltransferase family 1 protein, partial [Phormidesmis sp.]